VWVTLVPFLWAIGYMRPRAAAIAGVLWGTATIWAVAYWVPSALTFYYQQPGWFGLLFCIAASLIFWSSYYAAFAACASWIVPRCAGVARALLLAALWVTFELARARLLSGEPWLLLGYALVPDTTLIQAADLGGVYALSFVVVFINASLVEFISLAAADFKQACLTAAPAVAVLLATSAYGVARLATPLPTTPAVPVTVVQANNDLGAQWRPELYGQGLDQYLRLSAAAAQQTHPRVLVWPESAITFFLAREPRYQTLIARMLGATGTDLIVGAPHYENDDPARPQFFNSAFYVTTTGQIAGRYDKVHLLPFAEYFPLRFIQFLHRHFGRVRAFTSGNGTTLLHTALGNAAVVICFEAIFPDLVRRQMARGADVLVNLSNDVWLGHDTGPEQHLLMATLRAVENRTWLIRATTTGVSAIVDPYGRIQARTDTFVTATINADIVPMRVETVYKEYGDVFAYACVGLSFIGVLVLRRAAPFPRRPR
jgi:apolipoprotein N-acyltransferase